MTANTPASAKKKGRLFQQEVATAIRNHFNLPITDVCSRPMGSNGIDIMLSDRARSVFPFGVECKRSERWDLQAWWRQAKANAAAEGLYPLLVVRKNRQEPLVILDHHLFLVLENLPLPRHLIGYHHYRHYTTKWQPEKWIKEAREECADFVYTRPVVIMIPQDGPLSSVALLQQSHFLSLFSPLVPERIWIEEMAKRSQIVEEARRRKI